MRTFLFSMRLVLFTIFLGGVSSAYAGNITGTVVDADGVAVIGATILEQGTTNGTTTGIYGDFSLSFEGATAIIEVGFLGYKTKVLEVADGEVISVILKEDALSLEEVVVTGTANPRTKLESSTAITTLNARAIEQLAPKSTADLLQSIPGFLVETSGGESGNNLFARGIPSAGAYEYVQIQEDGLPVFEDGALQFANIDNFYRVDGTINRMEAVRGGTASIFATGAPGGIINFISKSGMNDFGGMAKLSLGDYGLVRTDINLGGPVVEDKLFFNIGGFYRVDKGIRSPGFDANKGGQLKANLTYRFEKGMVKLYYKNLNDRTIFYQSTPFVKKGGNIEGIDGFDPNYGTFTSVNFSRLYVPQSGGGYFEANLEDGIHPKSTAVGAQMRYYLSDNISIKNNFKITDIDMDYNAIFAAQWMGDVSSQDQIANTLGVDAANADFTFATTGEALPANTKLKRADFWNIRKQMENYANNLAFSFDLDQVVFNLGYYYSNWKANQNWNWSSFLVTVSDDPQLVNLMDAGTGEMKTYNGLSGITWLQRQSQIGGAVNAIYGDADINLTDALTANVGLRYDFDRYRGFGDHGTWGNDIGILENNSADDGVNILKGNFVHWTYDVDHLSYTGALNYKFDNTMAAYVRYSHGFRSPIEESFYGPAVESGAGTAGLADLDVTTINQAELGFKWSSTNYALFANAFFMQLGNIAYQDIGAGGTSEKKFASVNNPGLELELIGSWGDFKLRAMGTVQNPQYTGYEGSELELNDNQARRISKFYCSLRPEYDMDDFKLYLNYNFFGKKFQDINNNFELPGFGTLGAGVSYTYNNFVFAVDGTNLLNTIGLTEADGLQSGLAPEDGQIFMGRSILGRAIRFSVTTNF